MLVLNVDRALLTWFCWLWKGSICWIQIVSMESTLDWLGIEQGWLATNNTLRFPFFKKLYIVNWKKRKMYKNKFQTIKVNREQEVEQERKYENDEERITCTGLLFSHRHVLLSLDSSVRGFKLHCTCRNDVFS